jgi:GNAT superfamily N-acetyltransferase
MHTFKRARPGKAGSIQEETMEKRPLHIRPMERHELDAVLDWAAAEGWNPGLYDAACFHAADPEGFLIGLVDGEPVASIFAVKYGGSFGFIGGYIVKPAFRGLGYGISVWNAAMARLAGRNVGLDGVLAQQPNYAKSGFRLARRNIRFEGAGTGQLAPADNIVPLSSLDFEEVCRYDRTFFPDDRVRFLRCWIHQASGVAIGAMGPHGLAGYGVLRPCRNGYKIGPLFADTPVLADALFVNLLGNVALGVSVFLDVPEPNASACSLAARHKMQQCFETARMYTGPQPELYLSRQYGITTFELG